MIHQSPSALRRGLGLWPGMIFALIGLNVCVVAVTVYFAYHDRSVAIEPDYYQRAVLWNQTAQQMQINRTLGWTMTMEATSTSTSQLVELTLCVKDQQVQPIQQALVQCVAFSSIRSSDRVSLTWNEVQPGAYSTVIRPAQRGLWEFRFAIRRGDEVFTTVLEHRLSLNNGGTS